MPQGNKGCIPAEFEKQAAIVLGMNELLPIYPKTMIEIVSSLIHKIPLVAIVNDEDQRRWAITMISDWGMLPSALTFISLPVKGMWIRDYGPAFVRSSDGSITLLDPDYVNADRPLDDLAPTYLADLFKLPVKHVPLVMDGGSLITNGKGLGLVSSTVYTRNASKHYTSSAIQDMLRKYYGISELVNVTPLHTEPTQHLDMFATFTSADTLVLGQYNERIDPVNHDLLEATAQRLSSLRVEGRPLKIVRVPMPRNHGNVWRTYTNVIYANGTMLMPIYPGVDRELEEAAREIYQKLLPSWEIIGIDASELILRRGALRCCSMNVPWLEEWFEAPQIELRSPSPFVTRTRMPV